MGSPETPLALVNGEPVTIAELGPELLERAGRAALEGLILDRALAAELQRVGLSVTTAMVDAERALLVAAGQGDSGGLAAPGDASQRLSEYLASAGLDRAALTRQLRRNAALRALVAPGVVLTPQRLALEHRVRHGERSIARVIVVASASLAQRLRERLTAPGDGTPLPARFASLAFEFSADESAPRGGLLAPLSVDDPRAPLALRQALLSTEPGQLSGLVGLPSGYALVLVEQRLSATGVALGAFEALQRDSIRHGLEREAMDALLARLISRAVVVPMGASLGSSPGTPSTPGTPAR